MADLNYDKICFVVMPFGKKKVGDREVDFDFVYHQVFKPAISDVDLPADEGGGKLEPHRTDQDTYSASITQDMFEYLEYSRFVLADISGLNANVFYELGVRHRAHESGTAIFRQETGNPPFDISQIKAFPYEYQPEDRVAESVALIRKVLTESLKNNRLDSPPMIALRAQRNRESAPQHANIEPLLIEAEQALRFENWTEAIKKYGEALAASPKNEMVLLKRGIVYRDQGQWEKAIADFTRVTELSPRYAEAWRELGIAQNKWLSKLKGDERAGKPSGEEALRKSVELNPDDFDALSSLAGVLKRQKQYAEAAALYERATEISNGNTYPLLNMLTLRAAATGSLALGAKHKNMLLRAEKSLRAQAATDPPYNAPWSVFDLAQTQLFLGKSDAFLEALDQAGLVYKHVWQLTTFRETLELLVEGKVELQGLADGVAKLKELEG
jgi:tetratricopeptide (TPR) repeat protein